MTGLLAVRQSLTKWNLFLSACIFAAGLLLKVGAPVTSVVLGIGLAAVATAMRRYRQRPVRPELDSSVVRRTTRHKPKPGTA
jgi:hypothetical protein